jgi:hypothetical protein
MERWPAIRLDERTEARRPDWIMICASSASDWSAALPLGSRSALRRISTIAMIHESPKVSPVKTRSTSVTCPTWTWRNVTGAPSRRPPTA